MQPSLFTCSDDEFARSSVQLPCGYVLFGILDVMPPHNIVEPLGWELPEDSMYVELEEAAWHESPIAVCWVRRLQPDRWDVVYSWEESACSLACSHETEEEARACGSFLYDGLHIYTSLDQEYRQVARSLLTSEVNLLSAASVAARIRDLYINS